MGVFDTLNKPANASPASSKGGVFDRINQEEQAKMAANINPIGGVGNTSYGPVSTQPISETAPTKPVWKSLTDNPIVHGAETALGAVNKAYNAVSHLPVINQVTGAMQGAIEPFVHSDAPASNEPLWEKYLGNVKDAVNLTHDLLNPTSLITGNLIPSSTDKSIVDKVKATLHSPESTLQGAIHPDQARQKLSDSLKSKSTVTNLAVSSLADPLSYVPAPSIKGVKGLGETFDRLFGKVKPAESEPLKQDVLALPPAKSPAEIAQMPLQERLQYTDDIRPNPKKVSSEPLGLPQGNYTEPTRLKVAGNNQTLDYVITKIKPEVMDIIQAPTRRDLLVRYIQKNTGYDFKDIANRPINELIEIGQVVQGELQGKMQQIATQVAAKYGHDLPSLLEGKAPSISEQAAKDAQSRVYGVPAPDVTIKRPDSFNITHENPAAAPRELFQKVPSSQTLADARKLRGQAPAKLSDTKTVTDTPKLSDMRSQTEEQIAAAVDRPRSSDQPKLVNAAKLKDQMPNERGFATTLKDSEKTPEEFKNTLDSTYTPLRNVDAVNKANKRIDKSIEGTDSFVMSASKSSPEKVATAGRLIDHYNKTGDFKRSVTIAEKVAKELTEAGQTVQAASIFNRLTPEGALFRVQQRVAELNKAGSKFGQPLEVTEKNAQDIKEAAEAIQSANVSKERASNVIDIMDKLKAKQAITEAEKASVQSFIKDAQQYVRTKEKPIRERPAPSEMGERRVKDKVISFLDAQEAAAKARMAARRGQVNSLPLDEYADMAIIVAAKLARGTIKTADIAAELVKDFGESVKPHLASIFDKANDLITQNAKRISKESVSQAERITENYITKNEAHISPEDVHFVRGLAKQVSALSGDAKRAASQDLHEVLNSFEKAGIGKKISTVQYIAMLLNPLTQVKNILGNELLYRLSRLSRNLQTPLDMIVSAGKERTITSRSGPMQWKNFYEPTYDYISGLFQGAKAGWRGINLEGLTTSYDISGQVFRSKLNPLTYLEKTLGATMKGFDYAAFNRATQQRLREMSYLDALNKGVTGKANIIAHMDKYMVNLDDNIAEIAHEYGKVITLQNKSLLADKLQSFRGGLNHLSTVGLTKDFGAGSLVVPFAKTPANLLMRAIEYSPAGFGKAIIQAGKIVLQKDVDLTRADVIQSITDAILGTGIAGVGIWLASKGVLKGESSSDKDVRELEKLSGLTQYQLNATALQRMMGAMVSGNMKDIDDAAKIQPLDQLYQYEWAQPSSIPLALGANIVKERQQAALNSLKGQTQDSLLKKSFDVSMGAMNTLFNTSVLQGLQQAFDFQPGENNKVKAFLMNVVKQAPSMFVPSMVGKINQFNDSAVRETYSPDFMQNTLNPSQAKISGEAQKLPQRVNTLGQPESTDNSFSALFLNPATKTTYSPNPEAKMVLDLMSETGDATVAPRSVPKYITGKDPLTHQDKKVNLTGAQLTEYQTIVGQETLRLLGKLPDNLSTQAKVKAVVKILAQAGDKGRSEMRKQLNLR